MYIINTQTIPSRIHSQGLKPGKDDPNSRAVMFEAQKYSKKRVHGFLLTLNAFAKASMIPELFTGKMKSIFMLNFIVAIACVVLYIGCHLS